MCHLGRGLDFECGFAALGQSPLDAFVGHPEVVDCGLTADAKLRIQFDGIARKTQSDIRLLVRCDALKGVAEEHSSVTL